MSTSEQAEVAPAAPEAPAPPSRQTAAPVDLSTGKSKLEIGGPTMRAAMERAFDKIEARDRAPQKPVEGEAAPKAPQGTPTEKDAQGAPVRGEDGKFKSTRPDAAKPEAPAKEKAGAPPAAKPAEQQQVSEADKASEKGGEPAKAIAPPVSWSAAAKARWADLPPDIHAEVDRRERDFQKGLAEKATEAAKASEIFAALEPVRQHLELNGVKPAQYVQQLAAADKFLRDSPEQAIQEIARLYGIDLRRVTNPAGNQQQPAAMPGTEHPALAAALGKIEALEKRIAERDAAEKQSVEKDLLGQIEAFKADPKYPHFETVRAQMGALMATPGGPKTLADAYEQAVWAHPEVRASIEAQRDAERKQREAQEAAKRAADAERAASINVASRAAPPGGSPTKGRSLRESLSKAYDRATAGA